MANKNIGRIDIPKIYSPLNGIKKLWNKWDNLQINTTRRYFSLNWSRNFKLILLKIGVSEELIEDGFYE